MVKIKIRNIAFTSVSILCIAFLILCSLNMNDKPFYAAQKNSAIKTLEDKLSKIEDKISELDNQIKKQKADITNEINEKENIDKKLGLVKESIDAANDLILEYNNQITQKEKEISDKEIEIENKYNELIMMIKITYEQGDTSYLEFLLNSKNFSDFLGSTEIISNLLDYQKQVMEELNQKLETLNDEKEKIEILRNSENNTKNNLELQKKEYNALSIQSSNYIASLQSKKISLENEKNKSLAEIEKLNAQLEEELEKLAKQNTVYIGGSMIWPLDDTYKRVSSGYGYRGNEFHLGIDVPADYGSNIYAANSGKVIHAEKHYSYGYYVLIDHGGGIATLYAHASKLLVSVGDTVKQGDIIAEVGSTGYSTGNHLHFEIRKDGKTVDPTSYK